MGCSSNRFGVDEDRLDHKSAHLGFESQPTDHVVGVIRRYALSLDGKIKPNQLQRIQSALHLTNSTTTEAIAFYAAATSVDHFLVAAIYMSKGTAEAKAEALFELEDFGLTGALTESDARHLVELLVNVAVEVEPKLIQSLAEDDKKYLEKVKGNAGAGVKTLTTLVIGKASGSVKKEDFVKNLVNYDKGKLVETGGIREYLSAVKSTS